ncbi:MAG: shikimate dehydrogenase [Archangium sp.]
MSIVEFLIRVERGTRARRVVTLPPNEAIEPFAWRARHAGADLLEIRTDLHPPQLDLLPASRALPLLVAERGAPVPDAWLGVAELHDVERFGGAATLFSHHAPQPLEPIEALARWKELSGPNVRVKHVEPLGTPESFPRLLDTQVRLLERFGEGNVTVLATGALALPFRAVLNRRNALDYCSLDATWRAAPGQRLLADSVREARGGPNTTRARLGILGSTIAHSRSPRIHPQPFDRIELPPDTDVVALTRALWPHYRGFAVTNPFKKRFGAEAINTLVREVENFRGSNTDVAGAQAMWEALGSPKELIALGDGGATAALRQLPVTKLDVLTRAQLANREALKGTIVWTWPADVEVPASLRFSPGTRVAVIAYGPPAHKIAAEIRARGGEPVRLGPRWFIAQARQQRTTWESTS